MTAKPNRRKRPRLSSDWRNILRRAWSIRFSAIAALFSVAEVLVPIFADQMPRGVFAIASALSVGGAMIARVIAQKDFSDDR